MLTLGVSAVVGLVGCTSGPPPPTSIGAPSLTSTQRTTLIDAAARGDLSAVRAALGAGADVRTTDADGATALVRAAYGNHVEVAETLLAAGADPNHQDRTQQSAYLIATSEVGDDVRLLDLVLAHGADVNAKDSYNGTGLIRAAERGYPRIVARLIAAGGDPRVRRPGPPGRRAGVAGGRSRPADPGPRWSDSAGTRPPERGWGARCPTRCRPRLDWLRVPFIDRDDGEDSHKRLMLAWVWARTDID